MSREERGQGPPSSRKLKSRKGLKPGRRGGSITSNLSPTRAATCLFNHPEDSVPMITKHRMGVGMLLTLAAALAATPVSAQEVAKFFPADTEIVISVSFRQALESELFKDKKEQLDAFKAMV